MKPQDTVIGLSIEQAQARRLQENARRIEEGIIDRICAKHGELGESEFRDFAMKGIYEVIALRKVVGSYIYNIFRGNDD